MIHEFKRAFILCMLIVFLCGLAACGEDKDTVVLQDNPYIQPEYLSFFSPDSLSDSDVGKYWSDSFSEEYDKEVYVNFDGAAYYAEEGLSYRELLERRLKGSAPDDLYIINAEDVIEFERKGYWMDLSAMDFVDNLSEAALYQSTYNGKVFSVPLTFTGFGFYWNVDMLQEHGLKVPENLDEFWNVCEKLKENGILPYGANKGFALTVPAMGSGLATLYGSDNQKQRIAKLNSGETAISSYMRDGFEFIQQMIDKGYMDSKQALETVPNDEMELFLSEGCAFICIGMGVALEKPEENSFQLELTGLPLLPDGCIAVYGADSRLCVNPNSAHLQTALQFIEMAGTVEALDKSAQLANEMSTAKESEVAAPSTEKKMYELLQSPGQIPNQDFTLHFNTWENIRNVCREICGGSSVDEACEMLDELQRTELEIYSGYSR